MSQPRRQKGCLKASKKIGKEKKMKSKKAITLLVLTTMLLAMVPLAPLSAQADVTLVSSGAGASAEWNSAIKKSGDWSVKLTLPATVSNHYAAIVIDTNMLFEDIDEFVLNYYIPGTTSSGDPIYAFT